MLSFGFKDAIEAVQWVVLMTTVNSGGDNGARGGPHEGFYFGGPGVSVKMQSGAGYCNDCSDVDDFFAIGSELFLSAIVQQKYFCTPSVSTLNTVTAPQKQQSFYLKFIMCANHSLCYFDYH